MIITCSLLAFGLAGLYWALKPLPGDGDLRKVLGKWSYLTALSIGVILLSGLGE